MPKSTRFIKRHDTAVQPRMRALDEKGVAIDLTGATATYSLALLSTGVLKVNRGSAVLADQLLHPGEIYYMFTGPNVNTAGLYQEEWEIVYPGGFKETFPTKKDVWLVDIQADIDNT